MKDMNTTTLRRTYTIETYRAGEGWTHYGLGDSTGWESREAAERAIESLRELGDEWATAEYRVIEVEVSG